MIEINDAVKERIQVLLAQNPGKQLRIEVDGDGCAGPYFRLSLDEAGTAEIATMVNGIELLISDQVKRIAELATINLYFNEELKGPASNI